MEQKNSKIFNKKTMQAVSAFCELNNIEDIDGFIRKCFESGFNIERYGLLGKTLNEDEKHLKTGIVGEKQVEIETIREIRVEVPVEIIKEVEKIVEVIKEVPVEIIKEIPVEKIITKIEYISDKTSENELTEKIFHLNEEIEKERQNFSTKTQEMENNFHYEMSKKEEELDQLRQKLDIPVDNKNEKMLQETLQKLRKEMSNKDEKIKELEKINQNLQNTSHNSVEAIFLRGSNLNNRL